MKQDSGRGVRLVTRYADGRVEERGGLEGAPKAVGEALVGNMGVARETPVLVPFEAKKAAAAVADRVGVVGIGVEEYFVGCAMTANLQRDGAGSSWVQDSIEQGAAMAAAWAARRGGMVA